MDLISLISEKLSVPYHLGRDIIHFYKIGLIWNLSVQFFSVMDIFPSCSHGHETTSVDPNILVHRKLFINIQIFIARLVNWQDKWYANGILYVLHYPVRILVNHHYQALSLYYTIMILPAICLGVIAFTGTIAPPQNDEKGLRRFRIV